MSTDGFALCPKADAARYVRLPAPPSLSRIVAVETLAGGGYKLVIVARLGICGKRLLLNDLLRLFAKLERAWLAHFARSAESAWLSRTVWVRMSSFSRSRRWVAGEKDMLGCGVTGTLLDFKLGRQCMPGEGGELGFDNQAFMGSARAYGDEGGSSKKVCLALNRGRGKTSASASDCGLSATGGSWIVGIFKPFPRICVREATLGFKLELWPVELS